MTKQTSPRGESAGFSLLELIIVLVLLGAAVMVVMPSFVGSLSSLELETATRDLITNMRKARSSAVSEQTVHRVVLLAPEVPNEPFSYVLTNEFEQPLQKIELPNGISFVDADFLPAVLSFYPNGRSSGGVIGLSNVKGKQLFIQLNPVTGLGKMRKEEVPS
jgi:prepilin-type N-terminal cleavage/methylation domain-containing protein